MTGNHTHHQLVHIHHHHLPSPLHHLQHHHPHRLRAESHHCQNLRKTPWLKGKTVALLISLALQMNFIAIFEINMNMK